MANIMAEALIGLVSGLLGALMGSYSAWLLAGSASRKQTRRDILVKTWQDLEALRVSCKHWYSQPINLLSRSGWSSTRSINEAPDPVFEGIHLAFDHARSAISSDRTLLMAHFSSSIADRVKPLLDAILELCSTRPFPSLDVLAESIGRAETEVQNQLKKIAA
jgi:hypothetical protein